MIYSSFSPDRLMGELGHDPATFVEVATVFFQTVRSRYSKLVSAVDAEKSAIAFREAHTLKGNMANFDAASSIKTLQAIELSCETNDQTKLTSLIGELDRDISTVGAELKSYCDTLCVTLGNDKLRNDLDAAYQQFIHG